MLYKREIKKKLQMSKVSAQTLCISLHILSG